MGRSARRKVLSMVAEATGETSRGRSASSRPPHDQSACWPTISKAIPTPYFSADQKRHGNECLSPLLPNIPDGNRVLRRARNPLLHAVSRIGDGTRPNQRRLG